MLASDRTIVFQSFRRIDVPRWLPACLDSVRAWSQQQGYQYRLIDDEFFDLVPDGFRARVNQDRVMMSDLARLKWAKHLLQSSERVIWIDADVLVFDPHVLGVPHNAEHAICQEIWVYPRPNAPPGRSRRFNNALLMFTRVSTLLDHYLADVERLLGENTILPQWALGPGYLTSLQTRLDLPLFAGAGLLPPLAMMDVIGGAARVLPEFLAAHVDGVLGAVNLCGSFRNRNIHGLLMTDAIYSECVGRLLASGLAAIPNVVAKPAQLGP